MRPRLLLLVAAAGAAALAVAQPAGATNECRGLNPCVPVAGPWVAVPVSKSVPRPHVEYQLTCPRGFVVAGLDAELTDRAIEISFAGSSGSPVSPGVTTSQSVVFVASYVGRGARAPTFRPHAGCVPARGGGRRTPTGLRAVVPPGQPTTRRVVDARVNGTRQVVASCRPDEELVAWYVARGFATEAPPSAAAVAGFRTRASVRGRRVVVAASASGGRAVVQVSAVCAGGR